MEQLHTGTHTKSGNLSHCGEVNFTRRVVVSRETRFANPKNFSWWAPRYPHQCPSGQLGREKNIGLSKLPLPQPGKFDTPTSGGSTSTPSPILDHEPVVRQIRRDGSLLRKASGHPRAYNPFDIRCATETNIELVCLQPQLPPEGHDRPEHLLEDVPVRKFEIE